MWQRCPICDGSGLVPAGTYGVSVGPRKVSDVCRACSGRGVLLVPPAPLPLPSPRTDKPVLVGGAVLPVSFTVYRCPGSVGDSSV